MAYIPRSSFSSTPGVIPTQIQKKHKFHAFNILSTLVIVGTLVSTVGVFFYAAYAERQLNNAKTALQEESDVDNEKYIEEISVYQKKLAIATHLLDTHIAPSHLFQILEETTNDTVQFKSLEFTYDPGFEIDLVVTGLTPAFASLALQEIQFGHDALFSDFVLSDVSLVEQDANAFGPKKVGFTVTGLFDKDLVLYTGKKDENSLPVLDVAPESIISESASSTSEDINADTNTPTP
ncbi:MAG: hypothetical protein WAW13_03765 [Minisyncoccia bacterium]